MNFVGILMFIQRLMWFFINIFLSLLQNSDLLPECHIWKVITLLPCWSLLFRELSINLAYWIFIVYKDVFQNSIHSMYVNFTFHQFFFYWNLKKTDIVGDYFYLIFLTTFFFFFWFSVITEFLSTDAESSHLQNTLIEKE